MRLIRRSDFETHPWKNGGGVTHEAVRVPAGRADFRWRISVAEIAESVAFSDFTGYLRHLTLLQGAGFDLRFANGDRRELRRVGDRIEFDGALAAECTLLGGPCTDLNLLIARDAVDADVRIVNPGPGHLIAAAPAATIAVFGVAGRIRIEGDSAEPQVLNAGDLALLGEGDRARLRDSGAGGQSTLAFIATLVERAPNAQKGDVHDR